ncbi:hypothetical protein DQT32_04950 [Salmonella enterica subsp. enterica serovar Braenderup]|nr:hypothetical protein [Salmonella enterica subsp. enterica serovar Braenderup]
MPIYFGWDKKLVEQIQAIDKHLHILVLRKSAAKLTEYINLHGKKRKIAIRKIIDIKYELSKCRPEVIAILCAMASNPKRFKFRDTFDDKRMALDDTAYERMYFQIYNFSSNPLKINPKVYINSKEFLEDHEEEILFKVVRSLDNMRQNEYRLQEELQALEEQKNVFETYQSEKLSSR